MIYISRPRVNREIYLFCKRGRIKIGVRRPPGHRPYSAWEEMRPKRSPRIDHRRGALPKLAHPANAAEEEGGGLVAPMPGKIIGVVRRAEPFSEAIDEVPGDSQYVLEVNGGFCDHHGVKAGDMLHFEGFVPHASD